MQKITVVWTDSNRYIEQCHIDDEFSFVTIKSTGWLVIKDKDKIVLCQDIIGDDIRGVLVIPMDNVKKIESL